jgi:hypothetical protein
MSEEIRPFASIVYIIYILALVTEMRNVFSLLLCVIHFFFTFNKYFRFRPTDLLNLQLDFTIIDGNNHTCCVIADNNFIL